MPDRSAAFAAEVHPLLTYAAARWPDLTVDEFYRAVQLMAEIGKMDDCQL